MQIFFRDDDFGWEMERFARLASLFADHGQKLNAAAIPQETSAASIRVGVPDYASSSVQFVVHGYRHVNHEPQGKKSEFGSSRAIAPVERELVEGLDRVGSSAKNFFPCFVPPWNSIDSRFLPLLASTGYQMLSRFQKAGNASPSVLERSVTLDLHTRKDGSRLTAEEILATLRGAQATESAYGVMLHHNRMEDSDYATLASVLSALRARGTQSFFYSELTASTAEPRLTATQEEPRHA